MAMTNWFPASAAAATRSARSSADWGGDSVGTIASPNSATAWSSPAAAASLNDLSPRPVTSNIRATVVPSAPSAAGSRPALSRLPRCQPVRCPSARYPPVPCLRPRCPTGAPAASDARSMPSQSPPPADAPTEPAPTVTPAMPIAAANPAASSRLLLIMLSSPSRDVRAVIPTMRMQAPAVVDAWEGNTIPPQRGRTIHRRCPTGPRRDKCPVHGVRSASTAMRCAGSSSSPSSGWACSAPSGGLSTLIDRQGDAPEVDASGESSTTVAVAGSPTAPPPRYASRHHAADRTADRAGGDRPADRGQPGRGAHRR